jgi:hypothetical protein
VSTYETQDLPCRACGRSFPCQVARRIDGSPACPERFEILGGSFQQLACPLCGAAQAVEGPLFYVDLAAGRWYGCFPAHWELSWRDLEREPESMFLRGAHNHSPGGLRASRRIRCVFGLAALREKLLCDDAGIDDVDLELLKLELIRSAEPWSIDARSRPRLREATSTGLVFAAGAVWFSVTRRRLDEIHAEPDLVTTARRELSRGPYVDVGRLLLDGTAPSPVRAIERARALATRSAARAPGSPAPP